MKLHEFNHVDGYTVFINPQHVVAVRPHDKVVYIYVTTPNAAGYPFAFVVNDDLRSVLQKLQYG